MRNEDEVEEEYVLLDLDSAYSQFDIPPNAPYVLSVRFSILNLSLFLYFQLISAFTTLCNATLILKCIDLQGLNTEHPVLTIGDKLNLVSVYPEKSKSCIYFYHDDL